MVLINSDLRKQREVKKKSKKSKLPIAGSLKIIWA